MQDDFGSAEPARPLGARRGFSLVSVSLLTGVMALTAVGVFEALQQNQERLFEQRRRDEARAVAEGGLAEILNDRRLLQILPTEAGAQAAFQYTRPASTEFSDDQGETYRGEVTLVRAAPALESSQRRIRAIVYEVRVAGRKYGEHASDVEAIIYRLGTTSGQPLEVYGR